MKKLMVMDFGSKNKLTSETGKLARKLFKDTRVFVKDISKDVSKVDWEGMYKDAQKSLRQATKKRNKTFRMALRKFKRTDFYKVVTKEAPKYLLEFKKWSTKQISKIQSIATGAFVQSKEWVEDSSSEVQEWISDQYPKVRKFIIKNYPGIGPFMFNRLVLRRFM
jgi:hypothetical protein